MHDNASHIIRMCLKRMHSIQSVVVEDTDLHVVGSGDDPVLSRYELGSPHRKVAYFKRFNQLLVFVVPHVDIAIVQRAEHPRFGWVEVHAFHPV